MNAYFDVRKPENEKILGYLPNTPERKEVKEKIRELNHKKSR